MPRCGVPVRQDGMNVINRMLFRRLTLRSADGTAQRAVPYQSNSDNPALFNSFSDDFRGRSFRLERWPNFD
jgi:hypothetical protein